MIAAAQALPHAAAQAPRMHRTELAWLALVVSVTLAAVAWVVNARISGLAQAGMEPVLHPSTLDRLRWEAWALLAAGGMLAVLGAHLLLRRSHKALKPLVAEQNARLSTVFDLSPDGFVVFDKDLQLVFVNQAFLSMTGWTNAQGLSEWSLEDFDRQLHELHDPAHSFPPLSMQRGDETPFDTMDLLHLQLPRPRVLTRLVRHNAGGRGESILYFRDVTHETEVDRMKSEFLTTAAHELRTPMVSVFGFTELLLTRPVPEHKRRDVLQTIHRQASLLINMVNELLDLARIEARQDRELKFLPCDVGSLLNTAVGALAGRVSARHQVIVEPIAEPWLVQGDAEKLLRAFTNVLSNAQKYSPAGGLIRLGANLEPDGRRVGVWVEDQGIGMTPEQLERVFERFYRADPSGNIPGTGLGMSLVKEIVEQHQGEIELHSAPGVGTRVTIYLPRVPSNTASPASTTSTSKETACTAS